MSDQIRVTFVMPSGEKELVYGDAGDTLLTLALKNNLGIEGACGGAMACSTCHIIVGQQWVEKLDSASEEETSILDLAWDVGPNSRLGCQIRIGQKLDGMVVLLPESTYAC